LAQVAQVDLDLVRVLKVAIQYFPQLPLQVEVKVDKVKVVTDMLAVQDQVAQLVERPEMVQQELPTRVMKAEMALLMVVH
jgi:hypothetical protein